jgi:hypothetical protein
MPDSGERVASSRRSKFAGRSFNVEQAAADISECRFPKNKLELPIADRHSSVRDFHRAETQEPSDSHARA